MVSKWPLVAIGTVADIFDGPHATPKTVDSGPIFLGIGALDNGRINLSEKRHVTKEDFVIWTRRVKPKEGDVVFSYETRLGEAAIIPSDLECCLGRRMGLVRSNEKRLDPRFFLYTYLSPYFQDLIRSRTIPGATVDRIALKEFPFFLIPLPPLDEQRAISRILGALDDKIDLNHRMNQTLEAMARALFKSWFVDFDSVPPENIQESELGLIPKGWRVVSVGELIDFNPTEPMRKGTLAPYLDMAALPTVGSWPNPPILREFGSGMRFRNGDTLLARITPCLENGKTALIQCLPKDICAWGSTEFIVMRPKYAIPDEYAYLLARDKKFREHTIRNMTGTSGRQRVQADSVAEFKVASPSDENVWKNFADFVSPIFKSIKANSELSQSLTQLRDTLLPKLISGELQVKDAERIAEAA